MGSALSPNPARPSKLEFRFCGQDEIASVMAFIDRHWSQGHVMATSRALMDWQHGGTGGRGYDYVIARAGDEIIGVLGFILTDRFDPALVAERVIWLALWKLRDGAPPGAGLQMLGFLSREIPHRAIGTQGINDEVARLYRALGYTVRDLDHAYVLHPDYDQFSLAQVDAATPRRAPGVAPAPELHRLDRDGLLSLAGVLDTAGPVNVVPRKSAGFLAGRYLDHPFYDYSVHAVAQGGRTVGALVVRCAPAEGARALRVVDGILPPDALPGLGAALQQLLVAEDAEFADLYHLGLDADAFALSGLIARPPGDNSIIIPNYFEPFARTNVRISCAYKLASESRIVAFKADADQDRPNRLE